VAIFKRLELIDVCIGGSFGVVYKAIERATGDIVAIKHVRILLVLGLGPGVC
jgi:hypothetical protein